MKLYEACGDDLASKHGSMFGPGSKRERDDESSTMDSRSVILQLCSLNVYIMYYKTTITRSNKAFILMKTVQLECCKKSEFLHF